MRTPALNRRWLHLNRSSIPFRGRQYSNKHNQHNSSNNHSNQPTQPLLHLRYNQAATKAQQPPLCALLQQPQPFQTCALTAGPLPAGVGLLLLALCLALALWRWTWREERNVHAGMPSSQRPHRQHKVHQVPSSWALRARPWRRKTMEPLTQHSVLEHPKDASPMPCPVNVPVPPRERSPTGSPQGRSSTHQQQLQLKLSKRQCTVARTPNGRRQTKPRGKPPRPPSPAWLRRRAVSGFTHTRVEFAALPCRIIQKRRMKWTSFYRRSRVPSLVHERDACFEVPIPWEWKCWVTAIYLAVSSVLLASTASSICMPLSHPPPRLLHLMPTR